MLRGMREPIGDPGSCVPVLLPSPFAGHQRGVVFAHGGNDRFEARWKGLACELFESRFGVKQIDMARPTFHKQEDDAFGFGRVVGFAGAGFRGVWVKTQNTVLVQEGLKSQ